jgi:Protein of unknown function (DUF2914)
MSTVSGSEAGAPEGVSAQLKTFKERHHVEFEISFFFAGFLFDVLLLHRIDSKPLLAHQGLYLFLSAGLIFWDHKLSVAEAQPTGVVGKLATYRLWAMHFFLGTLLNAFMVFYFRAASGLLAFLFLIALAVIIVLNELPQFRSRGPIVRVLLLSFAITSYLAYLLPVLLGALRRWQYPLAVAVGTAATFGLWKLFSTFTKDPNWTFRRAVLPGVVLQATLLLLYLAGVIPPVPLSLKHIGIYSNVTPHREQGMHYTLEFQPAPAWKAWRREDPVFVAPAGSKAWAFVKIFAPAKFEDRIGFAWEFDDPNTGWVERGKPFFTLLQGLSEDGYHTFAYSTLGKPGDYRVRVVTEDGREIGRKTFTFVEGEAPTPTIIED